MAIRLLAIASLLALSACATGPVQERAGVLEYLYPEGSEATPPTDVTLELPLRVGIAFAPASGYGSYGSALDETLKQQLMQRIASAFQGVEGVQRIEVVPSSYLVPGGGFANVDQIRGLLGVDLIALISYEQTQFTDMSRSSLTYWTIVGAYFIEGNENETHTFVDTSVFDIRSRALLFNAAGRSKLSEDSTAVAAAQALRSDSAQGFTDAVDAMIGELGKSLQAFREQAKSGSGTVRGAGTPALKVSSATVGGQSTGAGGAGALELGFGAALALGWLLRSRERRAG